MSDICERLQEMIDEKSVKTDELLSVDKETYIRYLSFLNGAESPAVYFRGVIIKQDS